MPWTRSASPTACSTVMEGFRAAFGSWNTICTTLPDLAELAPAQVSEVLVVQVDRARRWRGPGRGGHGPSVDLPLPLSPTSPTTSPGRERQIDAVDAP